jgi:hypothetical protein
VRGPGRPACDSRNWLWPTRIWARPFRLHPGSQYRTGNLVSPGTVAFTTLTPARSK